MNRKLFKDAMSDMNPSKLFNYYLQSMETEYNMAVINEVNATNPSDMGKVMGKLMPQVKGKADGKLVNSIVTSKLQGIT